MNFIYSHFVFCKSYFQQFQSSQSILHQHITKLGGDMLLFQSCQFLDLPQAQVEQDTPVLNRTLNYLILVEVW